MRRLCATMFSYSSLRCHCLHLLVFVSSPPPPIISFVRHPVLVSIVIVHCLPLLWYGMCLHYLLVLTHLVLTYHLFASSHRLPYPILLLLFIEYFYLLTSVSSLPPPRFLPTSYISYCRLLASLCSLPTFFSYPRVYWYCLLYTFIY